MTLFEYTMVNTATPNLLAIPDCKLLGSNIPILCHLSFGCGTFALSVLFFCKVFGYPFIIRQMDFKVLDTIDLRAISQYVLHNKVLLFSIAKCIGVRKAVKQ